MKTSKTTFFTQMLLAGIFLSMLATIQTVSAQEPPSAVRRNVVKLAIPVGREYYGLAYERTLSDRWSLQAEGGYLASQRIGNINFEGANFQLQGKRYLGLFNTTAPEGIYLAPFAQYRFVDTKSYLSDARVGISRDVYSVAGVGAHIGGQWLIVNNRIALEGYVGPGYNVTLGKDSERGSSQHSTKADDNLNWYGTRKGWGLTGGFRIGFAF